MTGVLIASLSVGDGVGLQNMLGRVNQEIQAYTLPPEHTLQQYAQSPSVDIFVVRLLSKLSSEEMQALKTLPAELGKPVVFWIGQAMKRETAFLEELKSTPQVYGITTARDPFSAASEINTLIRNKGTQAGRASKAALS